MKNKDLTATVFKVKTRFFSIRQILNYEESLGVGAGSRIFHPESLNKNFKSLKFFDVNFRNNFYLVALKILSKQTQ